MRQAMKPCAIGCCVAYILCYLFLPFIAVKLVGFGVSGLDMFSLSPWCYLPLIAGIAMGVCSLLAPGKVAASVCLGGAFIPLIVFFLVRSSLIKDVTGLTSLGLSSLGMSGISAILTIGAGVVLSIVLGIAAAVLCFLAENMSPPPKRTAGLSAESEDDW